MIMDRSNYTGACTVAILICALLLGCVPELAVMTTDPLQATTDAKQTLMQALEDEEGIARAHAIEALDYTLGAEAGEHFLAGLDDPMAQVRFASAMAIAESEYAPAKAKLTAMALDEKENKQVVCGAIYALYRLGDASQMNRIAMLLVDRSPWVRAEAATIMGKTGHDSAMDLLKDLVQDEHDPNVLIRTRESLATLGDAEQAVKLEGDTRGQFADDRIDAIRAVSRLGGSRVRGLLEYLVSKTDDSPLVRVAAAGGLGRMGIFSQTGYNLCIRSLADPAGVLHESAEEGQRANQADIRALQQFSAIALGWIGKDVAVDHLYPLLKHEDGNIRVAAAMSILQLLPDGREAPPAPDVTDVPQAQ